MVITAKQATSLYDTRVQYVVQFPCIIGSDTANYTYKIHVNLYTKKKFKPQKQMYNLQIIL